MQEPLDRKLSSVKTDVHLDKKLSSVKREVHKTENLPSVKGEVQNSVHSGQLIVKSIRLNRKTPVNEE